MSTLGDSWISWLPFRCVSSYGGIIGAEHRILLVESGPDSRQWGDTGIRALLSSGG